MGPFPALVNNTKRRTKGAPLLQVNFGWGPFPPPPSRKKAGDCQVQSGVPACSEQWAWAAKGHNIPSKTRAGLPTVLSLLFPFTCHQKEDCFGTRVSGGQEEAIIPLDLEVNT